MNGIDIASYQTNIDLSAVPCDFVIAKATQGTGYINPDFHRAMRQGLEHGKLMGAYHYAGGGNPTAEAKYFLQVCKAYLGKIILCLDWESTQNAAFGGNDQTWCLEFMGYVARNSPATPFLYISQSLMPRFSTLLQQYPCWIAQYPDYNAVDGYLDTPWNEGAYDCAIRQYTSQGYIPGWHSHLDLNKAYISREEWMVLAGGESLPQSAEPTAPSSEGAKEDGETHVPPIAIPVKTVEQLAKEVMLGYWGNGVDREDKLVRAGYDYDAVQRKVNVIYMAQAVLRGEYGSGLLRRLLLGKDYAEVQAEVNKILGVSG